jgi:DNA-directed RNA polymerase
MDKNKQITAFMPNFVHSLDSTTLLLLYESFYKTVDSRTVNFYSVHDCYGVTAKHIDLLISLLRSIYIRLYSDELYIVKFDEEIINFIISSYRIKESDYDKENRIIIVNKKEHKLPVLSGLIEPNKEAYGKLEKSLYLVK